MSKAEMNGKKILITGGPTNEPIDEVMKITNMSTGSFSISLTEAFAKGGYEVTLILNKGVKYKDIPENVDLIRVETTDEMMNAIKEQSEEKSFDAVIHASAVGDYKADFTFLMEDLAEEIFNNLDNIKSSEDILNIMTDPKCKIDNSSKISSYQSNLTVKLGLTPKIIGNLRKWMPSAMLLGCKLLENVSKEELIEVARKLCEKNSMDYIMANDLADLRHGQSTRYLTNAEGFTGIKLETAEDVVAFVDKKLK